MDTELMHSSHRRHLEVHIISNFKLQRPSTLVYIGFLLALSCLQMTLNANDLLTSLLDEFWPKVSTVSHFKPIKVASCISFHIELQMVPCECFLGSYYYRKIQLTLGIHSTSQEKKWHKLSTYLLVLGLPFLFGYQSRGDRLNCGGD